MASVPGVLDFIVPYILFNVQSATLSHPFWTSSCIPSASTSNLMRLLVPFGLPHAVSLLQRPICRACSSLLDFLVPSLRFNVQSAAFSSLLDFSIPFLRFNVQSIVLALPFWTSSCRISTSKSNPPRLPHQSYSPLVHRKKGAKKLTLPHSLFPMDQRGVEPLSENPSPVLLLS